MKKAFLRDRPVCRASKCNPAGQVGIFDICIDDLSRLNLVRSVARFAKNGDRKKVYNVNLHALNIAYSCARFRSSLQCADIVFCDGFGVVLASALLGSPLQYRNTPPDWMDDLADSACADGLSLYFCGDQEGVAAEAARIMTVRHFGLDIRGTHHGFFDKDGRENDKVISNINGAAPDILLVGMGMPIQEFWIDVNAARLNVKVFLPVGAAFTWYSGIEKRAPRVLTDHGLEWLGRLSVHPVRHFRRYVIGNLLFFARFAKWHLRKSGLPSECSGEIFPGCSRDCDFFSADKGSKFKEKSIE
jgi:N-acetylglucosaminyldiphosphoundecaprenol N-acetyl-beta-D-mannosaminyltransferase